MFYSYSSFFTFNFSFLRSKPSVFYSYFSCEASISLSPQRHKEHKKISHRTHRIHRYSSYTLYSQPSPYLIILISFNLFNQSHLCSILILHFSLLIFHSCEASKFVLIRVNSCKSSFIFHFYLFIQSKGLLYSPIIHKYILPCNRLSFI